MRVYATDRQSANSPTECLSRFKTNFLRKTMGITSNLNLLMSEWKKSESKDPEHANMLDFVKGLPDKLLMEHGSAFMALPMAAHKLLHHTMEILMLGKKRTPILHRPVNKAAEISSCRSPAGLYEHDVRSLSENSTVNRESPRLEILRLVSLVWAKEFLYANCRTACSVVAAEALKLSAD